MTVVAYDGKTLATDTQMTYGSLLTTTSKLRADASCYYASCGDPAAAEALIEWLTSGGPFPRIPSMPDGEPACVLWCVPRNGEVPFYISSALPQEVPLTAPYWAGGTGAGVALGAMFVGADAIKAVEAACKHDTQCGGDIEAVTVGEEKP